MKNFILVCCFYFISSPASGQWCYNNFSPLQDSLADPDDTALPGYHLGRDCGSTFVRIKYFILVPHLDSQVYFENEKALLVAGIAKATHTFLQHDIFLYEESIEPFEMRPQDLNALTTSTNPDNDLFGLGISRNNFHPHATSDPEYLHVFIGPSFAQQYIGFFAKFYNYIYWQGTAYGKSSDDHPLTHEIGHSLGLEHTHQTWGNDPALMDTTGTACTTRGDLVCDTPPDVFSNSSFSFANHMDLVDTSCNYVGGFLGIFGFLFNPLTDNIMSYYFGCYDGFTAGQGDRCRRVANHGMSSPNQTFQWDYAIAGVKNSTNTVNIKNDFIVPAGKKLYMNRNVEIHPGAELTVAGTLLMGADKYITVYPGGKLVVDSGEINMFDHLPTDSCIISETLDYWGGIIALGNSTANQLESNQGTVILSNAKIAKSKSGVGSGLTFSYNSIFNWPFPLVVAGGGIIKATNTTFENNIIAVRMGKYDAHRSKSKFLNCNFIVNQNYSAGVAARGFVSLFSNKGVEFGGCDFVNAHATSNLTENMYGIMSSDASFFVGQYCLNKVMTDCVISGDSSTFQGLKYGIRAHKISSNNTYHVHASRFIGNKTGVFNAGVDFPVILRNRFEYGWQPSSGDTSIGVLINTGTGYRIEDNSFYKDEAYTNTSVGILVANSGAASNEVYNNLIQELDFGLVSNGVNRNVTGLEGLIFKCNDVSNTNYDISVFETRLGSGIAQKQLGENQFNHFFRSAANKFSLLTEPESDFLNNTTFNVEYYHSSILREEPKKITLNKVFTFLAPEFLCESKIPGQFQSTELNDSTFLIAGQNFTDNVFDYLSLLYSYHNLIDEGHSTAYFETLVNLHGNDEVWQLRQSLIEQSPYLSTETLIDAVNSEILPNAILLEIILANPDASNNDDLMNALAEKQNPLPGYMIELIEASWGQETLRTLMEANLTALSSAVYRDLKYMLYYHAVDSLNRNLEIRSLLENATDLQSKYSYALNLALNNQLNQATNLIQDLPLHYPIAETESMDLVVLEELLTFVSVAVAEDQQYFVLDENNEYALEVLQNYYNEQLEDKASYPAVLIGNLICLLDDNCADFYPVLGNGQMQMRKAGPKAITQRIPVHADFKLYPNPATNYTSLAYQTNSNSKSFNLGIYNTQGQLIKRMELAKSRDEIVIATDLFAPGLYLVQLRDENGQLIGSGKLVKK